MISIRLEDPDGAPLPGARPGQYLTLRIQAEEGQRSLLRNYSLSGPPDAGYYRITVKREHDGAASGYLHTRLSVGDQLDVAAPRGTFILDKTHAPVLLISAGIGATPVLAMLQALAKEHSDREIWWLHGARSSRDHSFAAETRTLLASLPTVHAHVYYSRPGPNDREGRDFDGAGRLTASLLAELEPPRDAEAYLCGPTPFMDEISAGLAAIGVDAAHIHTEPFGPAPGLTPGIAATPARTPHPPPGSPGNGPKIEFARSNLAIPWSSDYSSLLELAEACDVPVRWSCRTGVCHNCETTLIAGDVDYNPDPVEPPAEGSAPHLLLTAARRRGARSVIRRPSPRCRRDTGPAIGGVQRCASSPSRSPCSFSRSSHLRDEDLLHGLLELWPSYLGYVLTFLFIGQVWVNHHVMFDHIRSADRAVLLLNTLLLMIVAFLPFATSVLAEALRSGDGQRTAVVFYGIAFGVTALTFNAVWQYASRHRLLSDTLDPAAATAISRRFQLALAWLASGALLGAVLPVLGLAVIIAFNASYWLPIRGESPLART